MFCKYCGTSVSNNDKFCMKCGNKINDNITVLENATFPQIIHNKKKPIIIAVILLLCLTIGFIVVKFNEKPSERCSNEVHIDTLLELENKNDIEKLLDTYRSEENNSYDVEFMEQEVLLLVDYNGESIDDISIGYHFEGIHNADMSIGEILSYQPSQQDIRNAENFLYELVDDFTEKFGEPQIFNSPVNTTTYTWFHNECEIEVIDCINSDTGVMGAVDIRIKYGNN